MAGTPSGLRLTFALALVAAATPALAQKAYGPGVTDTESILKPAGLDASNGIVTLASIKPLDPTKKDAGLDGYVDFMKTRAPGVDPNYGSGEYAYVSAGAFVALLTQCGDNLTRENIMKQAASLKGIELPLLPPGITLNTTADDYSPIKDGYMMQFEGAKFVVISDLQRAK